MTQSKINIEADAGRLLRTMANLCHGSMRTAHADTPAVAWLLARGFVHKIRGEMSPVMAITIKGREYYEGLCANPSVTENPRAWVDEARSQLAVKSGPCGMVTRESKIDRACIPGVQAPHTTRTPEDMMSDMERDLAAQAKWCEKLGVSPDELQELGSEGRIQFCDGCESVGIFDRKGDIWRHVCRKCRKERRAK